MIIMTHVLIPAKSAKETGKCMLGLPPFPDYLTIRGPYIYSVEGEGIHSIDIFEVEKSKMAEALEFINNRHVAFFDIPGYTYGVNVCLDASEGIKMLGLD
ncbi:hypothetical protein ACFL2E_12010 [Thermodesulfobacteriota bacterium]